MRQSQARPPAPLQGLFLSEEWSAPGRGQLALNPASAAQEPPSCRLSHLPQARSPPLWGEARQCMVGPGAGNDWE